ncbi:hypothetical protein [Lelliottia nimipressuralis]|uniref:Uncharacterized protein n=1 Tax=Lelliottia nimipressuralis TaxID=69220 RepID=A0ABD4K8R4_9ENTR|nr:hypothetical protein [Lelliottia nimipressuralis]MBF4177252.1 hypothetical protein [Lelliottia nimipressuralis]
MKPKWPKLPHHLVPLFECANVYLCRTRNEWRQACAVLGISPGDIEALSGATVPVRNIETGENLYLLGVFNGDTSTLAHECAHIAFYVCGDVGVSTVPGESNESYCYLLDKVFSHFLPYITESEFTNKP